MLVSIYRYNPETDSQPRMQDYQVELPQGKDIMVLDVLQLVKEQDSSVTYRRSCREGVCGFRRPEHEWQKWSGLYHTSFTRHKKQ